MGLDVYLKRNGQPDEAESTINPEHGFRRGYFRSSYNGSGFNSVMHRCNCPDLYTIFSVGSEAGGTIEPNWRESLARAQVALEQYRDHLASPAGGHFVEFVSADKVEVQSERDALALYAKEARRTAPFPAYSNSEGHFYMQGVKLKAAIPGRSRWGGNGLFLVFESKREEGEVDWYETALLIVIETIEYVIDSGAPDEFSLYWSA